ncbi:MAG: anti-sigma factor family protein [Pyrinomonadaceae bacterium]
MTKQTALPQSEPPPCPFGAQAAAYLDGELGDDADEEFERHAASCASCSGVLAEQRRLLCALDQAFAQHARKEFSLPTNFTEVVKARAQSDMSCVRRPSEKRRALLLCLLLALASFGLLGAAGFGAALAPIGAAWKALSTAITLIGNTLLEASAGAACVTRAVGGRLVNDQPGAGRFVAYAFFALAIALLLRLILSYHRAQKERASD